MPRRRTRVECIEYWGDVLRQHQESGLPVRRFCKEHKVSEPSFYKWRKQLSSPIETTAKVAFVPVKVTDESNESSSRIEIHMGPSLSVSVTPGFDKETLTRVVAALSNSAARS